MAKTKIDILLIENEPDLGQGFSRYLQYKGFNVQWESTFRGGWEAVCSCYAKLLIIDVQLPDGNGFDLTEQILQVKRGQAIFF